MDRAAVAVILASELEIPEILLIRRADRPNGPWSGHMAFPGGRTSPIDVDDRATAERETQEEIGVNLADHAVYLGPLNDVQGRRGGELLSLKISPHVYHIAKWPDWRSDPHEVADIHPIPITHFLKPNHHILFDHMTRGVTHRLPGIRWGPHVIWGLTYLILANFFNLIRDLEVVRAWQNTLDPSQEPFAHWLG